MIINKDDAFILEKDEEGRVIGKYTVLIPFANLNVDAYVSDVVTLPPLNDAVLRLYAADIENFRFERIANLLGVDSEDVENAYYSLLEKDFIDFLTKSVTDDGRRYITNRKITNRIKQRFNLVVNKITGEASIQEEGAFIRYKDRRKSNYQCPYERNEDIDLYKEVTLNRVKNVWDSRKQIDEYRYQGELKEILNISEKGTVFRKFTVYYFMNKQNNVEIRVYEKNIRDKKLEKFIRIQESTNPRLTKNKYDYFFERNVVSKGKNIVDSYENIDYDLNYFSSFDFFDNADKTIDIFLPLNSFLVIDDDFLYHLKRQIELKKEINIFISGIEPVDIRQRSYIEKIVKLSLNKNNVKIHSLESYCPQTILLDNQEGRIIYPKIIPINFEGIDTKSVFLDFKEVEASEINFINSKIKIKHRDKMDIPNDFDLNEVSNEIFKLIVDVDELFANKSIGFSWLANSNNSEIKNLLTKAAVTKISSKYQKFTTMLATKMVENFKDSTKKVKNKNYFDNEFCNEWPELSKAMNRIRVYRNSYSHDFFNKFLLALSVDIIPSDFTDYCPSGILNVYEYKQYKMIDGLHEALKITKNKLLEEEEAPF